MIIPITARRSSKIDQNFKKNKNVTNTQKRRNLSSENDSTTRLLDFLLGNLRNELGLDYDGLVLRQHALAQDLEEAILGDVNQGNFVFGRLVLDVLRDQGPELVDVDDGAVELVAELVEVSHTNLTEVPRVILIE
ncbi:hypothetical protein CIPAW_05G182800 [Carya illinoinensis]|uniref:Uncharacterized protein n=1 Tax=Carya illinoinensis TaxID=32201 RepID=A0A8T1QKG6_CARIL|nr:hypothetical protein CIPAW_05G182800 [Carya illinoinensis]